MGIFSSKYKTYVATTVTRVIEDKALPNSILTGAMKSLVENDEQMIEHAMEELTSAIGLRAHRMYEYGKQHYTHGLPKQSVLNPQSSKTVVMGIIETAVGGPVVEDYYHYGSFNNLHYGWVQITQNYGYNTLTNELAVLSTSKGFPVFLKDLIVVVADATLSEMANGSLAQWGIQPSAGPSPDRPTQTWATGKLRLFSQFEIDSTVLSDYIRVEYCWADASSVVHTESVNITVAAVNDTASYYQVKYIKDGVPAYWMYEDDSGGYPTIDVLYSPAYENTGSYFPWLYFRYNNVATSDDLESDDYKTSVKLAKYINMDFLDVSDAIHENPDITSVEQAMMMMCVPATTTNQLELRYLFDYFRAQYVITGGQLKPVSKPPGGFIWKFFDSSITDTSILIQDARFKMSLGFRNIFKTIVSGNIGDIGHYTMGSGKETVTETGKNVQTGLPETWSTNVNYHFYRKQITATAYEEVRVINLKQVYHIYAEYSVTADEDDDVLMIPLDRSITMHYSIPDREMLYSRSLYYVFNSRVVQEIKWYQQSWFKYFMIIVAIIITILTWGATIKLLLAAIAIGTAAAIMAVVYAILMKIVQQLIIAYIIRLFVKLVGIKIAFIVAIIAAIYGGYAAIEAGSINGAPWAAELLQLSTGITAGIQQNVKQSFDGLQKEAEAFKTFVTHEEQRLKDAEALLDNSYRVTPIIIFGETAQEYYKRTIHSGNIGPIGIDAISSYVDVKLTLPTLTQTLGDEHNDWKLVG